MQIKQRENDQLPGHRHAIANPNIDQRFDQGHPAALHHRLSGKVIYNHLDSVMEQRDSRGRQRRPAMTSKTEILETIAHQIFDLDTLTTRNRDALDFHELAVWQIKAALEAAYEAGRVSAAQLP